MPACPSCGAEVVAGAKFCGACGQTLQAAESPTVPPSAPVPAGLPAPGAPPSAVPAAAAPPPPPRYPVPSPLYPPPPIWAQRYTRPRTSLPPAAGALLIISGLLTMLAWGLIVFVEGASYESIFPGIGAVFAVCGLIEFVFAIVMIAGGVMAIERRMWGLGLAGSILGLFTIGFILETSIMSLIALILLAVSKNEFR